MINWLKKLFKSEQKSFQSARKEIFLSQWDFYLGCRKMKVLEVKSSQSGHHVETQTDFLLLREKGELHPEPYSGGKQEFKAKWLPKSGWSLKELEKLQMITPQERVDKEAQLMIKLLEK